MITELALGAAVGIAAVKVWDRHSCTARLEDWVEVQADRAEAGRAEAWVRVFLFVYFVVRFPGTDVPHTMKWVFGSRPVRENGREIWVSRKDPRWTGK